jgi:hypothetical protein
MPLNFGLLIESVVAVLLLLTIGYCMLLNHRLKRLRADEQVFRATIGELIAATEGAERAIAGLKLTVQECDDTLGERLRTAERFSAGIDEQIASGEQILGRLSQIAGAAAPRAAERPQAPADAHSLLAAARAFADRARTRSNGRAA